MLRRSRSLPRRFQQVGTNQGSSQFADDTRVSLTSIPAPPFDFTFGMQGGIREMVQSFGQQSGNISVKEHPVGQISVLASWRFLTSQNVLILAGPAGTRMSYGE